MSINVRATPVDAESAQKGRDTGMPQGRLTGTDELPAATLPRPLLSELPPALPADAPHAIAPPAASLPSTAVAPTNPADTATPVTPLALDLLIPVAGMAYAQLSDTFADARGTGRSHDAIDIMAPTGTPVLAVADGTIVKLFESKPGGLTIYQFDEAGEHAFYYAHLDRYAIGLVEGQKVKRGHVIGTVGYSGNANLEAPHLHFAIFVLGPEKNWWQGTAINPYGQFRGP